MIEARRQVLLASAGSGKTYRLSGAYLELVAHGAEPERILATTFTRKAAGEIAQRVLKRAVEAATDGEAARRLSTETNAGLDPAGWARVATGLARRIETMRVRTIDAFFVALAQGAQSVLGLPPGWRLLAEHEEEALRLEAVDRALEDADREETLELLRMLHAGDPQQSVRRAIGDIARAGADVFWNAEASPDPWHALRAPDGLLDNGALRAALDAARGMALPLTKAGAPDKRWQSAVMRVIEAIEAGNPVYALGTSLCAKLGEEDAEFQRRRIEEHHRATLLPLVLHCNACVAKQHHDRTSAAFTLIARTELALERLKRERGMLTFSDVPRLLARLQPDVRLRILERLDARVEHLLLDEYQDTSLQQHALVEPILAEIAAEPSASRAVVAVGDVKQALYLWREATPEILGTLTEAYPALESEPMVHSWRTAQDVLDEVNAVFDGIEDNPALTEQAHAGARAFARYWESQETAEPRRGMTGGVVLESVDASEQLYKGDARFERAAECAGELCARAPSATIGVLTRVRKGVIPHVLHAMKRAGVDASEEGGNPLTDAPAVVAALSALRFALHPGDTLASYHVGTSALAAAVGIADPLDDGANEYVSANIRRDIAEDGPAAVFARWRAAIRDRMPTRDDARFAQLVELARRVEREGGSIDLPELIARIETQRMESPSGARVRVMTIHAAKGLEFDAVILCDLERDFRIAGDAILARRHEPLGPVAAVTRFPSAEVRACDPALEEIHDAAYERHVLGELCGLYVAMTRARRWLHLIVDHPENPEKYKKRLSDVVRAALAPEIDEPGVLHATGDTECFDELDEPSEDVSEAEPVAVRLAPPGAIGAGALPRRAPSSASKQAGGISASSLLNIDTEAADAGTLVHAACEAIGWTDDEGWAFDAERVARTVAASEGAPVDDALEAARRVERALAARAVRGALARERYTEAAFGPAERVELWRERPFAARVPGGGRDGDGGEALMSGRFDRVVAGYAGGRMAWCEVVDFKSEAAPSGDVGEAAETYRAQMEAYRAAIVGMTGVHPGAVRTTLVFVDRGEVVTLG